MIGRNSRFYQTIIQSLSLGPIARFLYVMLNGAPERPGLAGAIAGLAAAGSCVGRLSLDGRRRVQTVRPIEREDRKPLGCCRPAFRKLTAGSNFPSAACRTNC
jgi:hypothetical protein